MEKDYLKLYDLERYLFDVVNPAFHRDHKLNAFDFFCIIIWKANRAKSSVAKRLIHDYGKGQSDLNIIIRELTHQIYRARDNEKERMRILVEDWRFYLPMASAILTVLYPDDFTVYDKRVCEELDGYHRVQNWKFEHLWEGYCQYREAVIDREPSIPVLRNKDRVLWAKSFERQLKRDIATEFRKNSTRDDYSSSTAAT